MLAAESPAWRMHCCCYLIRCIRRASRTSFGPRTSRARTPALFVHGGRDPFASEEELRAALKLIPARTELVELPRAGHELARGAFDVDALVTAPFLKLAL